MFFSDFKDVVPQAVLAAGLVWGGANYLLIAPKIGERIVAADHLPLCRADIAELAEAAAAKKLAAIPLPSVDPMQTYAMRQAEQIMNGPLARWALGAGGGLGNQFGLDVGGAVDAARRTAEANKRAAQEAYKRSKDEVVAWTQSQIDSAGDVCACVGAKALQETRTEWALYTGSLSLYQPAAIAAFDGEMATVIGTGVCQSAGRAS